MINHQNFRNPPNYATPDGYVLVPDPRYQSAQNGRMGPIQNMAMQQAGTIQTRPVIPAGITTGLEDIRPNEVPSDGTVSLFMMNDYSAVYAKAVNQQGTIDTVKYVPEKPVEQVVQNGSTDFNQLVLSRLDNIEKMIAQNRNKPYYKNYHKNSQNKEEKTDGNA